MKQSGKNRFSLPLATIVVLPTPIFDASTDQPGSNIPQNLANHIVDVLTALVVPILVAGIIYSAYILITSQGNPDAYKKVKKNIEYLLGGVLIILLTTYIFNFVAGFFLH